MHTEAIRLRDEGAEVVVIAPKPSVQGERTFSPGIDVIPIPALGAFGFPGVVAKLRREPWRALGALRFVTAGRAALRQSGPFDRVYAHWAVPCVVPLIDAVDPIEQPAPVEAISHGADVRLLVGLPAPARHELLVRIVRRVETWRFVSSELVGSLLRAIGDRELIREIEARVVVAPSPFLVPDVTDVAASIRRDQGDFVTSVGRLIPTKHVDKAIRAARAEGRRLVVIGDGPDRSRLEKLAHSLGADVTFKGMLPREHALAWLAASNGLWFASTVEGESTVLREARALGRPVRML